MQEADEPGTIHKNIEKRAQLRSNWKIRTPMLDLNAVKAMASIAKLFRLHTARVTALQGFIGPPRE